MTSESITKRFDEVSEGYSANEWVRPLVQLIPYGVGSAIDSLLGDRGARIQMERLKAMLNGVRETVERISENNIDKDFINGDEFYFLCRDVFDAVGRERSRDKIRFFKNVFIRGITRPRKDLDVTSLYLGMLGELLEAEILLLGRIVSMTKEEKVHQIPVSRLLDVDLGLKSTAANARFLDHLEQHHLIELREAYDSDLDEDSYEVSPFGWEFIEAVSELPEGDTQPSHPAARPQPAASQRSEPGS